jgi:uncharacterized membrane protein
MHDDAQVARVIVMAHALRHGQFPVRIVADLGYGFGYPIFNFYGPLPYYIGGILHVLGIDALTATKIMIGIGVVIGSVSMYVCSSSIFGTLGGLFSTVLFTYFPYRAVQLYVRGAIGELWATSFLPLVLFGLILVSQKGKRIKGILIVGLSLSAVILSHTVFGYIVSGGIIFVAVALFVVSLCWRKEAIRSLSLSLILLSVIAFGITAFFWLPALFEMSYTNVGKVIGNTADYKDHFICPIQLWDSPWGYGGSAPGCFDGVSFKLGKLHILFFIGALLFWLFSKNREKRINVIMTGTTVLSGLFVFLTLQISQNVWSYVPFSSFVQYPWRLLGPIGICIALMCGYLFYKKTSIISIVLILIFGGSIVCINMKLFSPQYLYNKPIESYGSVEELRWRASKVSDEYLPKDIKIPEMASQVVTDRVTGNEFTKVVKISETETQGTYEIEAEKSQELKLNMAFFPGWTYSINGIQVKPKVVRGQPYMILSSGISLLDMRFSDTSQRRIGNGLTAMTIVGIIVMLAYGKKIIRNHRYTRI